MPKNDIYLKFHRDSNYTYTRVSKPTSFFRDYTDRLFTGFDIESGTSTFENFQREILLRVFKYAVVVSFLIFYFRCCKANHTRIFRLNVFNSIQEKTNFLTGQSRLEIHKNFFGWKQKFEFIMCTIQNASERFGIFRLKYAQDRV